MLLSGRRPGNVEHCFWKVHLAPSVYWQGILKAGAGHGKQVPLVLGIVSWLALGSGQSGLTQAWLLWPFLLVEGQPKGT